VQPPAPTLCFAHPPLRAPPASTASLTLSSAHPRLRPPSHLLLPPSDPLTLSSAPPTLRSAHRPPPQLRSPSAPLTLACAHPLTRCSHPLIRSRSLQLRPPFAPRTGHPRFLAHSHALLRSPSAPQAPLTLRPPLPRSPSRSSPPTLTLCSAHPTLGSLCASRSRGAGVAQWRRQHNVQLPAHSLSAIDGAHLQLRSPAAALHSPSAPLTLTLFSAHPRSAQPHHPLPGPVLVHRETWPRASHDHVCSTVSALTFGLFPLGGAPELLAMLCAPRELIASSEHLGIYCRRPWRPGCSGTTSA